MRVILALALGLAFGAKLRAEEGVLNLKQLLRKAREQSESLGLARSALEQVKARRRAALGDWMPQVVLKASEGFADKGNTQFQSPGVRVNAREDFLKGLEQPAAVKAADAALAQAEADLAQADLDLEGELGAAYLDVLGLEDELATEQAVLESTQGVVKDLRGRVALGRNRQAELSNAEAQVARVQAALADLEGQLAQAREALASLCSVPFGQTLGRLEGLASSTASQMPVEADLERLPRLRSAAQGVALAEAQRLQAKGAFFPSLYAEGNYHLVRQDNAPGSAWDAVLGLDLPLFRGGASAARLSLAEAQLESAKLRLAQARRAAAKEARQAWQGLKQSLDKAEASRLALEAAEKSYADQQRDFRHSIVTSLDLLNAFQAVENARLEQLRARYATHRAEFRLRLALGQALP